MSWDMMAFKVPPELTSMKYWPKGWEAEPFSSRSEVEERLREMLPGINFQFYTPGSLWGVYTGEGYSMEISLGEEERIRLIWVAIRGDIRALKVISPLVDAFGLSAVDLQRGEFFDLAHAEESFRAWKASLDRYRKEKLREGQ